MRYNAPRITAQNWWSGKVLFGSLKGEVADMAQYMGPTASMTHIFQKLAEMFGTMASLDVLMAEFLQGYPG